MVKKDLDEKSRKYIADAGSFYEKSGISKISGQIIGWLMIADPPHQTMKDLTDVLEVSKSSISTNIRFIISVGFIKKFSMVGKRQDYYRINHGVWKDAFGKKLVSIMEFKTLIQRSLDIVPKKASSRKVIEEMAAMYSFYEDAFASMQDKWEKRRKELFPELYE